MAERRRRSEADGVIWLEPFPGVSLELLPNDEQRPNYQGDDDKYDATINGPPSVANTPNPPEGRASALVGVRTGTLLIGRCRTQSNGSRIDAPIDLPTVHRAALVDRMN